ncbi:glycine zipper domain-containing protein [Zwartia vadi]|uniref:glycine zipper domain-containing protein n=1 Tax=Zwartia vadi TaxID=3058168 RepID=UPI0025B55891|nr:glycine zipper domain-containing protein [Zwartia vadi]MDN3988679.1 glycine zipper domain-containing protein [Zwartia vadi]
MKKALMILPLCTALTLSTGCSNMNASQQSTLSGGAIGAAAGAGITAIAGGNPIWGAVGGAAAGSLGGYLWDKNKNSN